MPVPALPIPHAAQPEGLALLHREFRDLLQRPLAGNITVTGDEDHRNGTLLLAGTPVKVPLVDGVLSFQVPPGTYRLRGQLWNKDEETTSVDEVVTVGEEEK